LLEGINSREVAGLAFGVDKFGKRAAVSVREGAKRVLLGGNQNEKKGQ